MVLSDRPIFFELDRRGRSNFEKWRWAEVRGVVVRGLFRDEGAEARAGANPGRGEDYQR